MDSVDGTFSIDPVSGIVMLERTLDRESRDSYRLRVQATDQAGQEGALSSQVVHIHVNKRGIFLAQISTAGNVIAKSREIEK